MHSITFCIFVILEVKGSGWVLKEICGLKLAINKYDPLKCGSFIPTPPEFKNFVVNVKNDLPGNNYCFYYSIFKRS